MGRPSKLTPDQWAAARRRWEGCDRAGFAWLREEVLAAFGDAPSRPGMQQMAGDQGWKKGGESSEPLPAMAPASREAKRKVTGVAGKKVTDARAKVTRPGTALAVVQVEPVELPEGEKPVGYVGNGRPSKYRPEYDAMIVAYFHKEPYTEVDVEQSNGVVKKQRMATDPPMLAGFASTIGVSRDAVNGWATDVEVDGRPRYPGFADAYARARELNESMLARGGLLGLYEPRFSGFVMKNLYGWQDQPARAVAVAPVSAEELDRLYGSRMKAAQDRQAAIRAERQALLGDS